MKHEHVRLASMFDTWVKNYFWIVYLLIAMATAAFAGRAGAHLVSASYLVVNEVRPQARRNNPVAEVKAHGKDPSDIVKRNIFCSGCEPPAPAPGENGSASNEPQKSSLQLELLATMVCPSDEAWSMAIIRDVSEKEHDSAMFNRNATIFSTGATVLKVVDRKVYLRNAGRLEFLELDASPIAAPASEPVAAATTSPVDTNLGDITSGVSCSGNNCTVEKQLVDKLLANTTMLATSARFVPSIKDGKPNGFRLFAIRPNSIFGKIGLQNGDTVRQINGNDISTPDQALQAYTKLRNATHLSVQVERNGATVTYDYSIR